MAPVTTCSKDYSIVISEQVTCPPWLCITQASTIFSDPCPGQLANDNPPLTVVWDGALRMLFCPPTAAQQIVYQRTPAPTLNFTGPGNYVFSQAVIEGTLSGGMWQDPFTLRVQGVDPTRTFLVTVWEGVKASGGVVGTYNQTGGCLVQAALTTVDCGDIQLDAITVSAIHSSGEPSLTGRLAPYPGGFPVANPFGGGVFPPPCWGELAPSGNYIVVWIQDIGDGNGSIYHMLINLTHPPGILVFVNYWKSNPIQNTEPRTNYIYQGVQMLVAQPASATIT